MFRITIAAITIVLAVIAAPAFAGKGGSTATSSIAIASVDGSTNAAAVQSPSVRLGDTLAFRTTVEPLAGWEYPMVAVSCYQDVNGDGTVQLVTANFSLSKSPSHPDAVAIWKKTGR